MKSGMRRHLSSRALSVTGMKPDGVDLALLRALDANGRCPVAQLAQTAGVSRATAYNRLERLQADGTIQHFTLRVDPHALGLDFSALVLVSGGQSASRHIHDLLHAIREIQYAAYLSGPYDIALLVRTPTMDALRSLVLERLRNLPGIRNTQTLFVMDEVLTRINNLPAVNDR